jgi:CTP:molybdopterin cytidylyltransferase MocA
MAIPAILLAAGASRRLGWPKQLVEFEGETLLNRTIRLAREASAAPVLVVLGAHFAEICVTLPLNDVVLVHNDQWETGMASSMRAGLRALETCAPAAQAVLMLTCDQPRLTAEHLRTLLAACAGKDAPIAASIYGGTRGTPAMFPRALFPRLAALEGDKGARSILTKPPCELIEIDFPGGEVDIDMPGDLDELR